MNVTHRDAERRTITLYRGPDVWQAIETGPREAPIRAAFGTNDLPTAYMASCAADNVQRAIAALNPDALVLIAAADRSGADEAIVCGVEPGTVRALLAAAALLCCQDDGAPR